MFDDFSIASELVRDNRQPASERFYDNSSPRFDPSPGSVKVAAEALKVIFDSNVGGRKKFKSLNSTECVRHAFTPKHYRTPTQVGNSAINSRIFGMMFFNDVTAVAPQHETFRSMDSWDE